MVNFLRLAECHKEAFWDRCFLISTLMILMSIPRHSFPQCYVDDTKLTLNFNLQDQANAITKLKDLCRISNWTFRNQLLINPSKTILIIFGSRVMASKVEDFRLNLLKKKLHRLPLLRIWELSWISA